MTAREAADYARRHWRTMTDACRSGELVAYQRKVNAQWRIRRADVDTWLGVRPVVRRGPLRAL
ncbi:MULTISPECIES: helix-turn-helix domain-containing protein [unclassified Curtobacterium]|uniref:helix-turn-helix domain-containing protein n=1 Tax=unclassified Curtobacterium TaxID=257496 RepID=UPI0039AF1715